MSLNLQQASIIWNICNAENKMISVERILQYSKITSEAPLLIEECRPPSNWPQDGKICFKNLNVSIYSNININQNEFRIIVTQLQLIISFNMHLIFLIHNAHDSIQLQKGLLVNSIIPFVTTEHLPFLMHLNLFLHELAVYRRFVMPNISHLS